MIAIQVAPLGFAPSSAFAALTAEEAAELSAWLDSLPEGPEQCEVCLGPASPCIGGRCLVCSGLPRPAGGELDPALPWAHGQ